MRRSVGLVVFVAFGSVLSAAVTLPSFFSDHMVLQRNTEAPFWGWAEPGEHITISASWGEEAAATAEADGRWQLRLRTPGAGGPHSVTVKGVNSLTLNDVLCGDVWLCSGQSNMAMSVSRVHQAEDEIAAADFPLIRLLHVNLKTARQPQDRCTVRPWIACSPDSVGSFSATGFFFGRELHRELDIPIGLINSSWGGTCIEAWTSWDAQQDDDAVVARKKQWDAQDAAYDAEAAQARYEADRKAWQAWVQGGREGKAPRRPRRPVQPRKHRNYPANLFNAMIHPLVPFAIRGAIWYQGEANAGRGAAYREQLERMITSWRGLWKKDFPFYFVQLPNFRAPWTAPVEDGGWPTIRESFMNVALDVPKTGMAITIDIGETDDIHPKNKQDVGKRLALVALHNEYGKETGAWCGPIATACTFSGGKAVVRFNTGGAPLAALDGEELRGFALTGVNCVPVRAQAVIEDADKVVVTAPDVEKAVRVHYAWAINPTGVNLGNAGGLPASPFRFGQIPPFRVFEEVLPEEAERYRLVYAFDPLQGQLTHARTRFAYAEDYSADIKGPVRKIAYFLALQNRTGELSYAFVSMDPFTDDIARIGVPCKASDARFQTGVTGVTIKSNVPGIVSGEFPEGCNIEFWDCNYGPANAAKVPNADDEVWDFGDVFNDSRSPGYGCMQIHNWKEKQSLICFNRFGSGRGNDLGIGNSAGKTRDWTFTSSAKDYARAEFKILVLE